MNLLYYFTGDKDMKIYSISDLHLSTVVDKPMNIFGKSWENYLEEIENDWNEKVSDNDIVLIAGDISWAMKLDEAVHDINYISKLKGKKILLKGNHDYWWSSVSALRRVLPENMYAIQNDALKLGDFVICGSRGWQAPENNKHKTEDDKKIYVRELMRMELSLQHAHHLRSSNEMLIVMIHYPPFDSHYNDSEFTKLFEKYNVNKVVYGHLHNYDIGDNKIVEKNNIKYYITSCDIVNNQLVEIA